MQPVRPVIRPRVLRGHADGKLPASILQTVPCPYQGQPILLVAPAHRAWVALRTAAAEAGFKLKVSGKYDSYRPFDVQVSTFLSRYVTHNTHNPDHPDPKSYRGKSYWLKKGDAEAASPGFSNHGLGLAIDVASETDGDPGPEHLTDAAHAWLVDHEVAYGFSHETSERWHIRYFHGDTLPDAVLHFEEKAGANTLTGVIDMPLTDKDAELVADKVWYRDSDPTAEDRPAWLALHAARINAEAVRSEVAKLRMDFNKFAKQDAIDDKEMLKSLLAALSPQEIAEAVTDATEPDVASAIADGIFSRVNNVPANDPVTDDPGNIILDPADQPSD